MADVASNNEFLCRNLVKTSTSTSLLLCILLTTSYTSVLKFPAAFDQEKPCVWQQLFMVFKALSFFSSVGGVLLFSSSSSLSGLMSSSACCCCCRAKAAPLGADQQTQFSSPEEGLRLVAPCFAQFVYHILGLLLSLAFAGFAYLFAAMALLQEPTWAQFPIILAVFSGGLLYILLMLVGMDDLLRISSECIHSHPQLWQATKRDTLFGSLFTAYLEYVLSRGPIAPSGFGIV